MQFKVKGSGHSLWRWVNNKGFAVGAIKHLLDGQIVTVDGERGPFVHLTDLGWTKRIWLEPEPVETPPSDLAARVADLERRVAALEGK